MVFTLWRAGSVLGNWARLLLPFQRFISIMGCCLLSGWCRPRTRTMQVCSHHFFLRRIISNRAWKVGKCYEKGMESETNEEWKMCSGRTSRQTTLMILLLWQQDVRGVKLVNGFLPLYLLWLIWWWWWTGPSFPSLAVISVAVSPLELKRIDSHPKLFLGINCTDYNRAFLPHTITKQSWESFVDGIWFVSQNFLCVFLSLCSLEVQGCPSPAISIKKRPWK